MVRRLSPGWRCQLGCRWLGHRLEHPSPGPQLLCYLGVLAPHSISHCHWETPEHHALVSPLELTVRVRTEVVGGESQRAGPQDTHLRQSL